MPIATVKQIVNPRQWIVVPDSHLIEQSAIDTKVK